jgi:hypothetical protein
MTQTGSSDGIRNGSSNAISDSGSNVAVMATGNGRGQQMAATAATAAMAAKQSDGIKDGISDSGRRWRQTTGGSNGDG